MVDPDAPALNSDGTLKDASEMVWPHSPSDEHRKIGFDDPKKRKRTATMNSQDGLPSSANLKGKLPAQVVAGKHVKTMSGAAKQAANNGQLTAAQRNFFMKQFTGM